MLYPGALACWTQDDALQGLASRDKAPECDHQLACQGDDHRLARAETAIGSAGAVPQCQCALLLKQQEAPGELDHAVPDPSVAGAGEPWFPPLGAALVRRARQTGVARHRFSVTHWPREHLLDEHIGRFSADPDNRDQLPNHGVWPGLRLLLQSFLTSCLDLPDLADHKAQPRHVALQLGQDIWRQRHALRGMHGCQTFGRLAQGSFETANAQPGEGSLHAVDDARALCDQALALAIGPLGILFGNRRYAHHAAMAPFATQPPQEPPLEQFGVQPIGFRLAMFPRNGHTRGMDHVRLYPTRLKPARQPEAVAAGFEGKRNPRDSPAAPDRLIPPAMQHGKQPFWARLQLLARLTLNTRNYAANQPARLAQLDDGNDRTILVEGDEGSAQVVRLGHRGTPSLDAATKLPFPRRPPHSISRSRDRRDLPGSATRAALWRSEGKEKP